jgi:hypothetical protein
MRKELKANPLLEVNHINGNPLDQQEIQSESVCPRAELQKQKEQKEGPTNQADTMDPREEKIQTM